MNKMKKLFLSVLVLLTCLSGCSDTSDENINKTDKTEDKKADTIVSFKGVGDNLIHDTIYLDALQDDGTYDFTGMYESVKKDM